MAVESFTIVSSITVTVEIYRPFFFKQQLIKIRLSL